MSQDNLVVAEDYYLALGNKDIDGVKKCLHPDIQFISPFMELEGREALLESIKQLFSAFDRLTIRAKLRDGNQVAVIYNLECPEPVGICRAVALMSFKDGLISHLELFFDARPFEKRS